MYGGDQSATPSAPARKPQKRTFLVGGIVGLAIMAAIIFAVAGGRSVDSRPPSFTMSGSQTLIDTSFLSDTGGCHGINGFSDIYAGTNITVFNNVGTIVGVGGLEGGAAVGSGHCYFTFSIADVPAGQGPYQWEVAHRGRLTITEADARAGKANGTLGL